MIGYDDLMENELEIYIERERGRVELKCTGCIDLVDETTFVGEKCCLSVIFHLLVEVSDFSSGSVYIFFHNCLLSCCLIENRYPPLETSFDFLTEKKNSSRCVTHEPLLHQIFGRERFISFNA